MKLTWEGRDAFIHTKPVNELLEWIPYFRRVPFKLHNGGTNKYLDNVIRVSLSTDAELIKDRQNIPVCVATKRYRLFQHQDVFRALVDVLKLLVSDIQSQEGTLKIKEYGESMWVSFTLANHQLHEADRLPLLLEVSGLNTIGAGKALDIRLSWYEPTYKTRVPFGMLSKREVKFRKIRIKKEKELDSDTFTHDISSFLLTHLEHISGERVLYKRWINAKVNQDTLAHWIDTTVQTKWKYEMAARAYNIVLNGYDIRVKHLAVGNNIDQDTQTTKKLPPPSELTEYVSPPCYYERIKDAPVKFAPSRNAFDVSLALSWLLSQQTTITKQLKWVDIPELMEALVAMDERLRFALN